MPCCISFIAHGSYIDDMTDLVKEENNRLSTASLADASKHHEDSLDISSVAGIRNEKNSDSNNIKTSPILPIQSDGIKVAKQGQENEASEQPTLPTGVDYTVLTTTQKKLIVFTASLASVFSPTATAIYYPSLETIARDLGVSNTRINITVTLFLVIQEIAPAFVANLADTTGRRPMYIFCFLLFNAANIGLALQNNFTALLILRMVQSAGSSGTVALANGVVGDIVTSAERGTYVAYTSLGPIFGPMIAPVLGGIIGQYAGWHFIFWFLLIFSAAVFIPLILFMPETRSHHHFCHKMSQI
ncbi:hypothetical protein HYALB_00004350 [Hymenoscyphus albidus]|uniref:Major facilitator superfamily (MFS) profile domain-containing protein n=1 Tax=Hymenoscyphus albidus TaxID=595503 RepID=A0A9N9QCW0_9HELO|nr:hypothetical protein HYALB_00004350 [Hymenoscyphus albidus]